MKAVILDLDTLAPNDLDLSALMAQVDDWQLYPHTTPSQLSERIADADIVLSNKVVLNAEAIASAKRLKLIVVMATGVNNIDLEAAKIKEVMVCNALGYSTASVVQHCFALMLALATRLLDYQQAVRCGDWQASPHFCLLDYPVVELAGKTLGIIGYGELGKKVAAIARAMDMQVIVAESLHGASNEGRVPLKALLAQSDVISLHCPLTARTRNLIDCHALATMKRGSLLINTARGGIVDESALVQALQSGHLAGAGIDVLATEPPPKDSILLADNIPNLVLTPHSAWGSRESRQRLVAQLAAVVRGFIAASPIQQVQ